MIGDAQPMHNPTDVAGFTASILGVLTDANYAEELKQKGVERSRKFSWDEIAKKTAEVYRRMIDDI